MGGKIMEVNAEVLRQRYSTMETEALIELRKEELTELALDVLDEVLKLRGITFEEKSRSNKKGQQGTGGGFMQKRLFRLPLSGWLGMFLVIIVGNVILSNVRPVKTNRSYLKEVIESGYIEKAAIAFLNAAKKEETGESIHDSEWEKIEKGLSECMLQEANNYLVSRDSFLDARANKETPQILAERFFRACGALE
jgi:hypothetical protein